ncbi:hypothetical protein JIQ42_00937 [Leishmania sp. Namibia]|uniref:hypothetical protein n=1 Tax=Leishmania sp. Namibia TaxID=2802991 RepID=UPI001B66F64A|nr:hypothetical protein JIQ42_00937 [Leishmania sp. Namibia]
MHVSNSSLSLLWLHTPTLLCTFHESLLSRCRVTGNRTKVPRTHKVMSEIEETFQRISQRPNVTGIIVVDNEGTPIRSTIEDTTVQNQYAHLITSLAAKARHCVRDLDPTNDLCFLRIRSKKNEIMVAPDKDFILIVIQNIAE